MVYYDGWLTDNKKDYIKLKDVYNLFKDTDYFTNMKKEQKRKKTYAYFLSRLWGNLFKSKLAKTNSKFLLFGRGGGIGLFRLLLSGWFRFQIIVCPSFQISTSVIESNEVRSEGLFLWLGCSVSCHYYRLKFYEYHLTDDYQN